MRRSRRMSKKVVRRMKRKNTRNNTVKRTKRTKIKNTRKRILRRTNRRSNGRTNRRTNRRSNRRSNGRTNRRSNGRTSNKENRKKKGGANILEIARSITQPLYDQTPGSPKGIEHQLYYFAKLNEDKVLKQLEKHVFHPLRIEGITVDGLPDYSFKEGQLIDITAIGQSQRPPTRVGIKFRPLPFLVKGKAGRTKNIHYMGSEEALSIAALQGGDINTILEGSINVKTQLYPLPVDCENLQMLTEEGYEELLTRKPGKNVWDEMEKAKEAEEAEKQRLSELMEVYPDWTRDYKRRKRISQNRENEREILIKGKSERKSEGKSEGVITADV